MAAATVTTAAERRERPRFSLAERELGEYSLARAIRTSARCRFASTLAASGRTALRSACDFADEDLRLRVDGLDQNPSKLFAGIVKQSDGRITGIPLEREVITESAVQLAGCDPLTETSVEFLHVSTGHNVLKEILSHNFLPGETRKPLFVGVISEDRALSVELDDSIRKRVQFLLTDGVNRLETKRRGCCRIR